MAARQLDDEGAARAEVSPAAAMPDAGAPPSWDLMFRTPAGGGLDWGTSSRLGPSLADYTG